VTEKNLQPFVDFYRPQVLAYASEWEKTFGCRVKETGLYFSTISLYVNLQ
jgi:ATP-dependent helicase/nuclease subunit A